MHSNHTRDRIAAPNHSRLSFHSKISIALMAHLKPLKTKRQRDKNTDKQIKGTHTHTRTHTHTHRDAETKRHGETQRDGDMATDTDHRSHVTLHCEGLTLKPLIVKG